MPTVMSRKKSLRRTAQKLCAQETRRRDRDTPERSTRLGEDPAAAIRRQQQLQMQQLQLQHQQQQQQMQQVGYLSHIAGTNGIRAQHMYPAYICNSSARYARFHSTYMPFYSTYHNTAICKAVH